MAKGKRIAEGKTLTVYSTKVTSEFRVLLDVLAKANGPDFGQRELLEEMARLYMASNPEKAQKARTLLQLLGHDEQVAAAAPVIEVDFAAKEAEVVPKLAVTLPKRVMTAFYLGNSTLHLYDESRKDGYAACGLKGDIDISSIEERPVHAVDCKKCRYCRKAVFA